MKNEGRMKIFIYESLVQNLYEVLLFNVDPFLRISMFKIIIVLLCLLKLPMNHLKLLFYSGVIDIEIDSY